MPKKKTTVTNAKPKVATLREETGLTQQQLAVYIGVSTNTIQNWEKGASGVDQFEKILKLCTVLNCNLEDLIEYSENEEIRTTEFSIDELKEMRKKWID